MPGFTTHYSLQYAKNSLRLAWLQTQFWYWIVKITTHYLPPNVTSLIQLMDQGVLVALNRHYKKKLLRRLLIDDENGVSIIEFLKSVNMNVVVELVRESWDEIKASTLRKSWRKIMPIQPPTDQSEDLTEGQEEDEDVNRDKDEQEFVRKFQELGYSINENEIHNWLNSDSSDPGFHLMTYEPEPKEGEPNFCPVSNSMAVHMFEKYLTWLEYQSEVNQYNTCTLRELHACSISPLGFQKNLISSQFHNNDSQC